MADKKIRAIRADELPEWCSSDVIATLLGKTVRRVQQLSQEGIIHTDPMPGSGVKKYKLTDTMQAYAAYLEDKANKRQDASQKEQELEMRKLEAEVALKESQGELHRMKTEIASGRYLAVEEIQLDYSSFLAQFKKMAMAIPPRVGGMVAGYIEPVTARGLEKDLSKEITNMLRAFVEAAHVPQNAAAELTEEPPVPVKKKAQKRAPAKKAPVKTAKKGQRGGGAKK